MKIKTIIFAFAIITCSLIFLSCEGPKYFSVTVIDKTSRKPIDSVYVKISSKRGETEQSAYKNSGYTDSLGNFNTEMMIGMGMSFKKFVFFMEYSKNGYKTKTEEDKTNGLVELEKD
ncbi:MAG: hypothetical protein A2275_18040 [Bacteroidetes bacterium RIFOXYA12_FULL_35_11]|nr:MAG: hypothetical protein A2X01_04765 [Bacteroidetes bacterium GWF2_35_48]OFY72494.1 MAG: hypothetical protein A2275_18040 [Bacteroidetes bacterium RIFOXYA12_FULL_35_11]HBX51980.1 hypothetical protein [Bacteroidales bacterium]